MIPVTVDKSEQQLQLISALQFISSTQGEQLFEIRRRAYLTPLVFAAFFQEDSDRKQESLISFQQLVNTAREKGVDYSSLVIDYLEDKCSLPPFIEENLAEFLIAIKYLVFGNPEIERGFSETEYNEAVKFAEQRSAKILDQDFFVRRRKDF